MDEVALEPCVFFRTMKVRELLLLRNKPVRGVALSRFLRRDAHEMREDLHALVAAGLALEGCRGFELTEEGQASLRWSAPPPPEGVIRARWVGELARAIADHYGVTLYETLHSEVGHGVVARSRLCFALWSRGWPLERIEEHFGLTVGWARRAVERWKRMRDELPPRSGPELRAWRERHGYTQAQAAEKLGVTRRTIIRAERYGSFSPRTSLGQA